MFSKVIQISVLGMFLLLSFSSESNSNRTNIMMIGDSITQGGKKAEEYSYRYELFKTLNESNVCYDFIGSQSLGHAKDFVWPKVKGVKFDSDHEGYYGIKTAELYQNLRQKQNLLRKADIVLLHIGTNDRKSSNVLKDIEMPLLDILKLIYRNNSESVVFVSLLNQRFGNIKKARESIKNALLLAKNKGQKVFPVDHFTSWVERPTAHDSDTIDWVHPNLKGQEKMATAWFSVMKEKYELRYTCKR